VQTSLLAWWMPKTAILAGLFVPVPARAVIWIVALVWMGIAYCQQHSPVRLVSSATKSGWKFYAKVDRPSWPHSLGQKAKYSLLRFAPDTGLKSNIAGNPFRASTGQNRLSV
jgi:hypothetical protein